MLLSFLSDPLSRMATRLTDQINQTLPQLPHLGHRVIELPQPRHDDIPSSRILARASLLEDKPGQRQEQPDGRGERDEDAEPPVVILLAGVDVEGEHDADDDGQDDDLADGLDVEGHVGELAAFHRVGDVVLVARDLPREISLGCGLHLGRVARQPRERRRPEGQRRLVGDQAEDVQGDGRGPLVGRVDAQPCEADGVGDDGEHDEDIGSPVAEVGEAADGEEDDDLDGEGDAVAEEDDAVDGARPAGEDERASVTGGLGEEILESCRGEVCVSISINLPVTVL